MTFFGRKLVVLATLGGIAAFGGLPSGCAPYQTYQETKADTGPHDVDPDLVIRYNLAIYNAMLVKGNAPAVRCDGARGLAKLGAEAVGAIRALEDALADEDDSVRECAAEALAKIRADAAHRSEATLCEARSETPRER
jgi:hypothetical protein